MKRKISAIILALVAFVGIPVITAPAASAASIEMACVSGGFHFTQKFTLNTSNDGLRWEIPVVWQGYTNPGWVGLEWRVRVIRSNGIVVFDNGYNTNPNISYAAQSVGNFSKSYSYNVKLNVGRLGDGVATCENNYYM